MDVQYARSGDVNVAYRVVGEGNVNVVFVPGLISHIQVWWEERRAAEFLDRLASFARIALFDKRGTGLSDPVSLDDFPTFEVRMDDVRAVMDAAGMETATVLGFSEGGALATLFAATHPDRTNGLILWSGSAMMKRTADTPWGVDPEGPLGRPVLESILAGNVIPAELWNPSVASDPEFLRWWERAVRFSASPAMMAALVRMNGRYDIRDVLSTVRVPTLVLHPTEDVLMDAGHSRYLAEHIPGARLKEFPGRDHFPWIGNTDEVIAEIREFLTGDRGEVQIERVLLTVLFTDVVDSTVLAGELGDRAWKAKLDAHDTMAREVLERHRGRLVKTTGDGILATFDGPGRAALAARAILDRSHDIGLELRAGIHTGECEIRGDDLAGIAVHVASRIVDLAASDEVLVSRTVRDLVIGSGLRFEDRGAHTLKGIPHNWELYALQ